MLLPGRILGSLLIVRKSLRQHVLSTSVTIFSIALGAGLVMDVFTTSEQAESAFTGGPVGFDAVLGARGSQLQLVLNTVFHLETSPGNIPWSMYKEMKSDPRVQLAVPYAVGDNYRGFRIVGTTIEMFTDFEYQAGRKFEIPAPGRCFDAGRREAVLGSIAAGRTGLALGSTFSPYHGVVHDESARHPEEYVVVGILAPTGSPSDRVVWIPIEGIFRMKGHVLRGTGAVYEAKPGEAIPDEAKEVSAVMLKFKKPEAGLFLDQKINKQGKAATLAWPIEKSMIDFFEKIGWIGKVLRIVAYLVVVVACGSILASIYNTMNERRREFAILRALGAGRGVVFGAIVLESTTIASLGSLVGYAVHLAIGIGAAQLIRRETGVVIDPFAWHPSLWAVPLGVVGLGALSGLLPAWNAYSTDVAANLAPSS